MPDSDHPHKAGPVRLGNPANGASVGFHIAVNDDDGVGDYSHIGWTGQAHHEYTYGTLTLAGPSSPPPTGGLQIVEIKPDLTTGNITLRWLGSGPEFQVEKAPTVTGLYQPVGAVQTEQVFTNTGALKTGTQSFYRIRQVSTP